MTDKDSEKVVSKDTFPRINGNVALKVQRLSVEGVRTQISESMNQQRPKSNFVTKLEVGTKSDLLMSRDLKVNQICILIEKN